MKLAAIQSNFVPWRGYFDFIQSVDLFVIYDDVQFSKNSWRNRNKIRSGSDSSIWLTVPVRHESLHQLIDETLIDPGPKWRKSICGQFQQHYGKTPFFAEAFSILQAALQTEHRTISQLNVDLIQRICACLKIETRLVLARQYQLQGRSTERVIDLLEKCDATTYVSGPSAQDYLDSDLFRQRGFRLEYKTYDYQEYPQYHGGFDGAVSVLDLIANVGAAEARGYLKSQTPNREVEL